MKKTIILMLAILLLIPALGAQNSGELTARQILERMDSQRNFSTARYQARMEIDSGRRVLVKTMQAVADGEGRAFIEFTNPEDRGVRYLKVGNELWMYFPDEGETVKISGHLLKEGMMGSDLSYEDALETAALADKYDIQLAGSERIGERDCYILELTAKQRAVPYERQKLWIDKERFISLQGQMFARSGRLLKENRALAVERFGERWYVTSLRIEDKLKRGNGTTFNMSALEFDISLPADQFSMRTLTR